VLPDGSLVFWVFCLRIPAVFGHRFRFHPDRIPADVGQRSGVCRTAFRLHPDSNPGRDRRIANPKSEIPASRPYFVRELVRGVKITEYCDKNSLSSRSRPQQAWINPIRGAPIVCCRADINTAEGREWTLMTLNGETFTSEATPTMAFNGGQLDIFGGVNRLSGSYGLIHVRVMLGELVSTRMAGPAEQMALEQSFAKVLREVDGFRVHGDELALRSNDQVVATFRAAQ
jgi:heat shock protein HslJ